MSLLLHRNLAKMKKENELLSKLFYSYILQFERSNTSEAVSSRYDYYINPSYMLENMALVFLPGTVNSGLCGKATFGI